MDCSVQQVDIIIHLILNIFKKKFAQCNLKIGTLNIVGKKTAKYL